MMFRYFTKVVYATILKMLKKFIQVQAVVSYGCGASSEICYMSYKFFHLETKFSIQTMIDRCKTTFTDMAKI